MKRVILILAAVFTIGSVNAKSDTLSVDEQLIREVKAELSAADIYFEPFAQSPVILIYDIDGKLLHSFQKGNIDHVAMRNAELLMESSDQKIFIKGRELNPTI